MFSIKQKVFFLFLSGIQLSSFSQTKFTDNLNLSADFHHGFVIPEYQNFNYIVHENTRSIGLSFSKKTIGKNEWEQLYNYPELGITLFHSTLGNNEVNGQETTIYPFFKLITVSKKKFSLSNRIGVGVSYVSRKFDLKDNYQNIAVGSHMNIHFNLKVEAGYRLFKKVGLQSGISFDHFSNGNLKEPNLGINYVSAYVGINYVVGEQTKIQDKEIAPHQKSHKYEFIYSFGGKHTRALQEKFYFTSSATFEYKWKPFRIFNIGAGGDLFYDSSTEVEMKALKSTEFKNYYDLRSGIHISEEFVYNRVSLILQEGVYVFLTDKVNHHIMYNRGIVRYKIADRFLVSIAMKSHLHILDYPEFGFGYTW